MEIANLTFIVTDDCNFNCSYCFQEKEKKTISNAAVETAINFFYPFLRSHDKVYINFYGGEPLLAYEQIKHAVRLLQGKNRKENKDIQYALTTNGSLLNDEMLDFFNRNRFALTVSFDGTAQDKGRKKGTLEQMLRLMKQIQHYPGINPEINSVFTPQTISGFSDSMRFMIEHQSPDITFNISSMEQWNCSDLDTLQIELERLVDFLRRFYREKGRIPVTNFQTHRPGGSIFHCNAGKNRMAVTPEGKLWGCYLFHDYFKTRKNNPRYGDYYFGTLADFIADYENRYPRILANYTELRQDFFQVGEKPCFLCPEVKGCMVCPVNAAYSSGSLGKISCSKCKITKIQRNAFGDQGGSFRENRPPGPPAKAFV